MARGNPPFFTLIPREPDPRSPSAWELAHWARLGLMLAHDGTWNGKRIVPREWLLASTSIEPVDSHLKLGLIWSGYGYQIWLLPYFVKISSIRLNAFSAAASGVIPLMQIRVTTWRTVTDKGLIIGASQPLVGDCPARSARTA